MTASVPYRTHAPTPPDDLSSDAAGFFVRIAEEYELDAAGERLLAEAARALDRIGEARAILVDEGIAVTDRFGQRKAHPMVAVERDARIGFARMLRELALEPDVDVRPPRIR
jgi:phage terminase small subunit